MKFTVKYNMTTRGLPTLFQYQYFTVDAKQRRDWDYGNLSQYLIDYVLKVSDTVLARYQKNPAASEILKDLGESQFCFTVSNNKAGRYGGNKQYIKCRVPLYVLNAFKNLFISTLVYNAAGGQPPEEESIEFQFDTVEKTVTITDVVLYEPVDNPYFLYARNAVNTLSVEAIGLNNYSTEKNGEIRDFYDRKEMSSWKERSKLDHDAGIKARAGVYMLFDEMKKEIYVGKAIDLQTRIKQHRDKPDDPACNFTHYRYSAISEEYYEFLYLIENAAIHDLAWVIDMPSARKYTPGLSKKFDLAGCKIINRVEYQTRKQG